MDVKKNAESARGRIGALGGALRQFFGAALGRYTEDGGEGGLKKFAAWLGRGLLAAMAAGMLAAGQCAFSTYPLGLALMCAARKYVPFMYAGLVTASLFNRGQAVPLFLTWTFAFLFRIAVGLWISGREREYDTDAEGDADLRRFGIDDEPDGEDGVGASPGVGLISRLCGVGTLFGERTAYRVAAAIGAGALIAAYRAISGGFLYYDALGGVLDLTVTPVLTYIFCGALEPRSEKADTVGEAALYTPRFEAGVLALCFCGVYALREVNILGFSIAAAAALCVTLAVSRSGGMLRGSVAGLICGLACHGIAGITTYSPIFGLAGLAAGLIWQAGAVAATALGTITGMAAAIATCGFSAIAVAAPDLLCGAVIFAPLAHFNLLPEVCAKPEFGGEAANRGAASAAAERAGEETRRRLGDISESLGALSEVFYTVSERLRRPAMSDIGAVCAKSFDSYCEKCSSYKACRAMWKGGAEDGAGALAAVLRRRGHAVEEDVPENIAQRCRCIEPILKNINKNYARLIEDTMGRDRTSVAAADYGALSELIAEEAAVCEEESKCDEEGCERLKDAARRAGFYANNIALYGSRRKNVIAGGVDISRTRLRAAEISSVFGHAAGSALTPPKYSFSGDYVSMSLSTARRFDVTYAKKCRVKEGETLCGDSITAFENKDDYFYSIVSDGMGSGRDAALTSRVTAIILEKMLRGSNARSCALKLANNFIRAKNAGDETFATVDMCEIDLLSGEAVFVKGGAAPSFIIRGGRLFKIASSSMPIGITREMSAEEITAALEDGDVIVMMTDGVAQSFEETMLLCGMLSDNAADAGGGAYIPDPDELLARLMDYASEHGRDDDVSAAIIAVRERKG
ncbi:MAG: SpoIIE family protein phosphatase [Eubacteriales bacterium]